MKQLGKVLAKVINGLTYITGWIAGLCLVAAALIVTEAVIVRKVFGVFSNKIKEIRKKTDRGTINLNTNGSLPDRVRRIAQSGLDSIRISLNSARPDCYRAYYRPRGYDFEDVQASIALSREMGLYTMINYLVFPGITDQEDELDALGELIKKTGINFLHLKNLCIDPQLYMAKMPHTGTTAMGMRNMMSFLKEEFPSVELGYFNRPVIHS